MSTSATMSMSGKASDPGSAWFATGSRSPAPAHNVRLIATAVAVFASVLGLALLLHLYICHVRRRNSRRRTAAAAAALAAEPKAPKTGLEPAAIAALPIAAYQEAGGEPGECAICLGAAQQGEAVRVLPSCAHVFHVDCVDTWLASSSSCPVCRAVVEPPPPPPSSSSATAAGSVHEKQIVVKEDVGTSGQPCGLGASLMKMLSRERPLAPRRPLQGDHLEMRLEDLESQLPQQQHSVNSN
ncbi:E3 ubiquitin-protein ligase ATL41-like [Lolium rigidum]|uniref:E3 ubiquitin-protein ligase ATL41-like n=1 Tax=Lolium rigidum TaxID=89674 RepID=UPI001F5CB56E|nr:E3 ubiquitin-protein ligase ATL41-like [Lolium rigidum]